MRSSFVGAILLGLLLYPMTRWMGNPGAALAVPTSAHAVAASQLGLVSSQVSARRLNVLGRLRLAALASAPFRLASPGLPTSVFMRTWVLATATLACGVAIVIAGLRSDSNRGELGPHDSALVSSDGSFGG